MILSVSQVENYVACPRRWWFSSVMGLKPEQTAAQSDGEKGHALFAAYFSTGAMPAKRAKLSKAVTAAIVKGDLPAPGADLFVEERFDGQPRVNPATGEWHPLDTENTLWLGGVPWDGFIDLAYRRGDVPTVLDHKFKSDLSTAKRRNELIDTVQLPVYVLSQLPYWPDATRFEIGHNNVCRTGTESKLVTAVVTLDQVLERKAKIETDVAAMKAAAGATVQADVPHRAGHRCDDYGGCPHQSICSAFKQQQRSRTDMELTDDEAALFADLDETPAAPPPPKDPPPRRRMNIVDAPAEPAPAEPAPQTPPPGPPPEPAKVEEPGPTCQCGAQITKDNGSKLQNGSWTHVGCPLEAPPAPPAAPVVPKQRRSRAPEAQAPLPLAPKAVEQPQVSTTASVASVEIVSLSKREHAIADVLESIARLLRTA